MRISSPPIISPCFYGIDTPTRRELIASSHTTEEIRKYITADSLAYLSLDGMLGASPGAPGQYCWLDRAGVPEAERGEIADAVGARCPDNFADYVRLRFIMRKPD